MKELFTKQGIFCVLANEKDRIINLINFAAEQNIVVDYEGKLLDCPFQDNDYCEAEDDIYINDPSQLTEPSEGFYQYTTHEYSYDNHGVYGYIGFKRINGEKLTDEIFYQADCFTNGLCAVCNKDGKWGCIDTNGLLVIPYKFFDRPIFNLYGVACGNNSLIDLTGHPIPNTELNYFGYSDPYQRYYETALWPPEVNERINNHEYPTNLTVDYYDTKKKEYILKNIPEERLDISFCEAEQEVIIKAASMLAEYETVEVIERGIIVAKRNNCTTIFDYYDN